MRVCIASKLRCIATEALVAQGPEVLAAQVSSLYGMDAQGDATCMAAIYRALQKLPSKLITDCGIKTLRFEDLGVSKEFYPNHGYYINDQLVLNSQLTSDSYQYQSDGRVMDKFEQTLFHELGHGWDEVQGNISEKEPWLGLSGWSPKWAPGLRRVVIEDPGSPTMKGEWCYDPSAGFTRFYAKRNPWDDFADSFAYYVAGMHSFLPQNKIDYLKELLGRHF